MEAYGRFDGRGDRQNRGAPSRGRRRRPKVTDRRTLTRRGLMGAAGGAAAVGALGPVSGLAGAHDRDRRGRGRGNEDYGRGRRSAIPPDRIGIQVFTVRDLLADNQLDMPGTFEVLPDAGYGVRELGGDYAGLPQGRGREREAEHRLRFGRRLF